MNPNNFTAVHAGASASAIMARFSAYTVAVFALALSLPLVIEHGDIVLFKENGPIEWFQCALLLVTSSLFFLGSYQLSHCRQVFVLIGLVSAFAAIRELDAFLDQRIPWVGWKIGFLPILGAVYLACVHKNLIARQLPLFLASSGFVILWAGFLIAVPVAQLVGHGAFLQAVMGDDYNRGYKRVIEETLETVGYILFLIGSFESLLHVKTKLSERHRLVLSPAEQSNDSPPLIDTMARRDS